MSKVVTGYKLVDQDYGPLGPGTRRHHRFIVGTTHSVTGAVVLCSHGFHFSPEPLMCLLHLTLPPQGGFRLLKVEADEDDVVRSSCGTKCVARTLRIVGEVADASAALTGVIDGPIDKTRYTFKAGRVHGEGGPAVVTRGRCSTMWTWYNNGVVGRSDGDADRPNTVVRYNDGSWDLMWADEGGTLQRDGDRPARIGVGADGAVTCVSWVPKRTDGLARVHYDATTNVAYVTYDDDGDGVLLTAIVRVGSAELLWRSEKGSVRNAALRVADDGRITSNSTEPDDEPVIRRFMGNPTLLDVTRWTALLASYCPAADVTDNLIAWCK
jgi:hypothetical protein